MNSIFKSVGSSRWKKNFSMTLYSLQGSCISLTEGHSEPWGYGGSHHYGRGERTVGSRQVAAYWTLYMIEGKGWPGSLLLGDTSDAKAPRKGLRSPADRSHTQQGLRIRTVNEHRELLI